MAASVVAWSTPAVRRILSAGGPRPLALTITLTTSADELAHRPADVTPSPPGHAVWPAIGQGQGTDQSGAFHQVDTNATSTQLAAVTAGRTRIAAQQEAVHRRSDVAAGPEHERGTRSGRSRASTIMIAPRTSRRPRNAPDGGPRRRRSPAWTPSSSMSRSVSRRAGTSAAPGSARRGRRRRDAEHCHRRPPRRPGPPSVEEVLDRDAPAERPGDQRPVEVQGAAANTRALLGEASVVTQRAPPGMGPRGRRRHVTRRSPSRTAGIEEQVDITERAPSRIRVRPPLARAQPLRSSVVHAGVIEHVGRGERPPARGAAPGPSTRCGVATTTRTGFVQRRQSRSMASTSSPSSCSPITRTLTPREVLGRYRSEMFARGGESRAARAPTQRSTSCISPRHGRRAADMRRRRRRPPPGHRHDGLGSRASGGGGHPARPGRPPRRPVVGQRADGATASTPRAVRRPSVRCSRTRARRTGGASPPRPPRPTWLEPPPSAVRDRRRPARRTEVFPLIAHVAFEADRTGQPADPAGRRLQIPRSRRSRTRNHGPQLDGGRALALVRPAAHHDGRPPERRRRRGGGGGDGRHRPSSPR